jgi:hypothetical protein
MRQPFSFGSWETSDFYYNHFSITAVIAKILNSILEPRRILDAKPIKQGELCHWLIFISSTFNVMRLPFFPFHD